MEQEFDSINNLPQDVKDFFHSNEPRLAVERACFLYNIDERKIGDVAEIVGDVFYGDIKLNEIPIRIARNFAMSQELACGISYELLQKIFLKFPTFFSDAKILQNQWVVMKKSPLISEEKAWKRVLELEPWILEEQKEDNIKKKKEDAENQLKFDNLSLIKALEKYPKINEQFLSVNQLKLQDYPELVRPSVRNWVKNFQDSTGSMKHTPIERGNFLFHGENGKGLSPQERQRVGFVLKSLDDGTPLVIDIENEKIIFDGAGNGENQDVNSNAQQTSELSFNERINVAQRLEISDRETESRDIFEKYTPKNIGRVQVDGAPADKPGKFYGENKSATLTPQSSLVSSDEKNKVILKEMAFSPNLVKKLDDLSSGDNRNAFNVNMDKDILTLRTREDDKVEELFSIPTSKPPIGSDEYNVEKIYNTQVASEPKPDQGLSFKTAPEFNFLREERRNVLHDDEISVGFATSPQKEKSFLQTKQNFSVSNFKAPANLPIAETAKPTLKTPEKKLETFEAPKKIVEQAVPQDPESLSDEMLFKMYQEKKLAQKNSIPAVVQNGEAANFSSPQNFSQKSAANPYHISPTMSNNDEHERKPIIQKNVVNLRANHES